MNDIQGNAPIPNAPYSVATGTGATDPLITVFSKVDPTTYDANYPIKKRWINTDKLTEWILVGFSNGTGQTLADWQKISEGGVVPIETVNVDVSTSPGVNPVSPESSGVIYFQTDHSGAGHTPFSTGTNPYGYRTSTKQLNEYGVELQLAGSNPAISTPNNFGIAQFDSNQFTVTDGYVQISGSGPVMETITGDDLTAVSPVSDNINLTGNTVAAGTHAKPVFTHTTGNPNEIIDVQVSSAQASSDINNSGLSSFSTNQFTVDANGFVNLKGGTNNAVLSLTIPGPSDILPDPSTGEITYTSTGGTVNITSSTAHTINFDITGGGAPIETITGDDGVAVSPVSNNINITGETVAAGTNAKAVYTTRVGGNPNEHIQVQVSSAQASADITKAGLASFDSSIFTVDSATGFVSMTSIAPFNPNAVIEMADDFINVGFTTGTSIDTYLPLVSNYLWNCPKGNLDFLPSLDSGHPGSISNAVISTAISAEIFGGFNNTIPLPFHGSFILGGGKLTINWVFKIVNLSNSSNRYSLRFGLGDTSNADQVNGCYFEYSDNLNSGNWEYKTASASSRTAGTSSTTATAAWHNAQITINAAATSVTFVMDGVTLGTNTTNIPITGIAPFFQIQHILGTVAAESVYVDLFYLKQVLTTPR